MTASSKHLAVHLLIEAAQLVAESWCEGDLADAVRALASAIADPED
jgi:hypothetical protein